ncbi:alpha/beta hydrolase [Actinocorallia longicatena]|uniref:Alpha/beta hydrolase fold domain-containing protein n=1 Tax=Actinocorallia longicatena TaxID=111803 RepID=A0ABP6Q886_9ACTN
MDTVTLTIERHARPSLRARALARGMRALLRPAIGRASAGPIDYAKAASFDKMAARFRPPRGTHVKPVRLDGFGAEWVHGPGVGRSREKVVLYFHGGGWISCGLNTHRRMIARLSAAAGVPAFSVDYRMLPEVTFNEEVLDCVAAYEHLLGSGIPASNIVVAGDSAGGYMAFASTLLIRDAGLPLPAAIIALSPMLDMDLEAKLAHANSRLDPTNVMPVLQNFVKEILADLDAKDPAISPIYADLAGLPPCYMSAGTTEILACDAEIMAERLAAAGVPCTLQLWDDQLHVFQMFGSALPESRAAIADFGRWVTASLPA